MSSFLFIKWRYLEISFLLINRVISSRKILKSVIVNKVVSTLLATPIGRGFKMAVWTEIEHGKAIALYEFLQENRQICDAHTVDFFTEDHWTGIVPDGWKETLLSPDNNHESFMNPENMKQCNINIK